MTVKGFKPQVGHHDKVAQILKTSRVLNEALEDADARRSEALEERYKLLRYRMSRYAGRLSGDRLLDVLTPRLDVSVGGSTLAAALPDDSACLFVEGNRDDLDLWMRASGSEELHDAVLVGLSVEDIEALGRGLLSLARKMREGEHPCKAWCPEGGVPAICEGGLCEECGRKFPPEGW
jgi:hypothetical protein